jgi:alpha-tubulin suppressor-like RCC1 family protein
VDLRLLAVGGALAAACYTPPVTASCEVRCSSGGDCPEGLECRVDGFCYVPGDQACPPPDGAAFAQLAAGGGFTCGIDPEHLLWCWGSSSFGQIGSATAELQEPVPRNVTAAGVDGWAAVAAGRFHACAIAEPSYEILCWGLDADGQLGDGSPADGTRSMPAPIDEPGPWDELVAGEHTTCALKSGELWCWGADYAGQVGDGDPGNTEHAPLRVGDDADWVAISASYSHTCGLRDEAGVRRLYCWGDDAGLGIDPPPTQPVAVPTRVEHPGDLGWQAVSTGAYFTCAIDDGGALWCWGLDDFWQLGDDVSAVEATPALVDDTSAWLEVSAGHEHVCAITGTALFCWGRSEAGQTGVRAPRSADRDQIDGNWSHVEAGFAHTCAVDTTGQSYCWGDNGDGQLGTGVAGDAYQPRLIDDTRDWTFVSAGETATCGIIADGTLECWGLDVEGLFGASGDRTLPAPIAHASLSGVDFSEVAVGEDHACAITSAQQLWCWGRSQEKQLGNGSIGPGNEPVLSLGVWSDVAVGSLYTCGVTGGDLWCWGYNEDGRTGELGTAGTSIDGYMIGTGYADVSTGDRHACGARTDGVAACWGLNRCNAVATSGEGATIPTSQQGSNWETIEAAWVDDNAFNLGINDTGNALAWGCAESGRLGTGDPITDRASPFALSLGNWTAVSVGGPLGCGIRGAGELYCWGDGSFGARGDGTDADTANPSRIMASTTGWQAVSVGQKHMCAIDEQSSLWCWGDDTALQLGAGIGMTPSPQAVVLPD